MGLFSKIKDNFKHGGVKVTLESPPQISANDTQLAIKVTLLATDKPQQVSKVHAQLTRTVQEQIREIPSTSSTNSSRTQTRYDILAEIEQTTPIALQPNLPVSVDLVLSIPENAIISKADVSQATGAAIGGAIEALSAVSNAMDGNRAKYEVSASADVEGIALDPSNSNVIQVSDASSALG